MTDFNKASPETQGVKPPVNDAQGISHPFHTPPRTFEGKKYYGAADIAKIIGVEKRTVLLWNQRGLFTADVRTHDGTYLYEIERVMQLKDVYRPDWNQPACLAHVDEQPQPHAKPSPTTKINTGAKKMKKISERTIERLKFISPSQLVNRGIIKTAPNFIASKQSGYCCPLCGSGTHDNRNSDGAGTFDKNNRFYCHACKNFDADGHKLSTIDLFAIARGLKNESFSEICRQMAAEFNERVEEEEFGNHSSRNRRRHNINAEPPKQIDDAELALIHEDIFTTRAENLSEILNSEKYQGKWRGLPAEFLIKFGCRFIWQWTPPKSRVEKKFATKTDRIIIPSGADFYLARFFGSLDDFDEKTREFVKNTQKLNAGSPQLFNRDALNSDTPIFVVEGAIDAMSVEFAGYRAVALNSVSNGILLVDAVAQMPKKPPVIILLDSDKQGRDTAPKLQDTLLDVGCPCCVRFLFDDVVKTDANDILVTDGVDNLRGRLESIFDGARAELDAVAVELERRSDSEAVVRDRITEWQKNFGAIEPDTLEEIYDAKFFLDELTLEAITMKIVFEVKTQRQIAMCKFYGFTDSAGKFLALLKEAQSKAAAQIKNATDAPAIDDVKALANLSVSDVRKCVAEFESVIKQRHEKYQEQLRRDAARQKAEKRKYERADFRSHTVIKLDELRKAPQSDERDAEIISLINDACEWKVDNRGKPLAVANTTANSKLIFTYDPVLDGAFGFDEFQQADVILKKFPWYKDAAHCVGETFKDRDAAEIRFYLAETYHEFGSVQKIDDAIIKFSNQRAFHPVKKYFNNLPKWDGKPRAETLFVDFLGVEDTAFAREITLNWLLAAVARIYYPGCRYQLALILHGNQGIGKSYIFERLGGEWYSAISSNVDDPHAIDDIQNIWIGEFKEMKGLRKADVNAIKAFIDTAADNRRAPFERRAKKVNRHVVFAITVNDDQFLSDVTGNRRFPILECGNKPGEYVTGLTDEYILQVWAEVKVKFKELMTDANGNYHFDNSKLELSREAKNLVEEIASRHMRDDGLKTEILGYLEQKIPPQFIWKLLTREQRRTFIRDGKITVKQGELEAARRARGGKNSELLNDIKSIGKFLDTDFVLSEKIKRSQDSREFTSGFFGNKYSNDDDCEFQYTLFGNEYRQHVSATEIHTEAFGQDKRKSMTRINEILSQLEGWKSGERLRNEDPQYPDQRKPYYRDALPVDDEPPPDDSKSDDAKTDGNQPDTPPKDDFDGLPLDPLEDPPF